MLDQAKLKAEERQLSDSPPKGEDPRKLSDMLEKFQGVNGYEICPQYLNLLVRIQPCGC